MIVRELITRLGFRIDGGNLTIYNQTINNIHNAADRASNAVSGLMGLLAAGGALFGIVKVADELQGIEARIKRLPQTIGSSAEAFDAVAARAQAAKQGVEGYATFYIKAANATQDFIKTQEGVLDVVDGVGFALAAAGTSAEGQKQAMYQLGQAIGSPTVQMQEMNTIIDVAPDLFRALGKAIPGANGNLKKFIGTGKVTGRMLAESLVKVMPEFRQQMLDMPMSMGTASTLMLNRWKTFIHRMNRESNAITSIANYFLASFDKIEKGLNEMVEFFGGATNAVKFFGIVLASVVTPMAFKAAAAAIGMLFTPLALLIGTLILLGVAWQDFNTWLEGGDSLLGKFFDQINEGEGPIGEIINKLKAFKNYVVESFKTGVLGVFVDKLVELKNGIVKAFDDKGVIMKFFGLLKKLFAFLSDITPFEKIVENIGRIFFGLVSIFFGLIDIIAGAFKILVGLLTGDFRMMYEGLGQMVAGFLDVVLGVGEAVIGVFKLMLIGIGNLFKAAFALVYDVIYNSIANAFRAAGDAGMAYLRSKLGQGVDVAIEAAVGLATSMVPAPLKNVLGLGYEPATYTKMQLPAPPAAPAAMKIPVPQAIVNMQAPNVITPQNIMNMQTPTPITPQAVSGAAASPSGVAQPMFGQRPPLVTNVYQTLPPGTPAETAKAARDATKIAVESSFSPLARQLGQLQ